MGEWVGIMSTVKIVLIVLLQSHIFTICLLSPAGSGTLSWAYYDTEASDLSPWMRYFVATRWTANALGAGFLSEHSFRLTRAHVDVGLGEVGVGDAG